MKRVLVTGANGQLGMCVQKIAKSYGNLKFFFKNSNKLDITKAEDINTLFEKESYDYCLNCAAYTNVEQAEKTPEIAYQVNAEAVKDLAIACSYNDVILIHISTDYVFDGEKKEPYRVEDIPNPINQYGKSKLKGEQYIQETLKQYYIIRTSWLYSEFGKNFLNTMLKLSSKEDTLNVIVDQISTPTYTEDLGRVVLKIMLENFKDFGLYHFSNEGTASWFDFAKAIFDESNTKIKMLPTSSDIYPTHAIRPNFSVLDSTKIKEKLNLIIPYWRDSLKNCFSELKHRP